MTNTPRFHCRTSIKKKNITCRAQQATVDFEAQDEAVLAKILVAEGTPDVPVGTPMMVLTESIDDAAAFKDFVPEGAPTELAPVETTAVEPTPAPAPAAAVPQTSLPSASAPISASGGRVIASPLAKMVSQDFFERCCLVWITRRGYSRGYLNDERVTACPLTRIWSTIQHAR